MSESYTVRADATLEVSKQGFSDGAVLFNKGTKTIYLGEDTSLGQSPVDKGVPLPVQTIKEWPSGVPCYAMCDRRTTDTSVLQVSRNTGLLTPPIGQASVLLFNQRTTLASATGFTWPQQDVSRFAYVLIKREEINNAYSGLARRRCLLTWQVRFLNTFLTVDTETIDAYCANGEWMYLGPTRGEFLIVQELAENALGGPATGVTQDVTRRLFGLTQPAGPAQIYMNNGLGAPGGGSLDPEGDNGGWCFEINGLAAATSVDFYPPTYVGEAVLNLRTRSTVTGGDGILVAVLDPNAIRQYISLDLDPATSNNDQASASFFQPPAAQLIRVDNDSTVALNITVSLTSKRHM